MTGKKLWEAVRDGDAAKVSTLLSTQGAQSFINFQDAQGGTPLHCTGVNGHESITKQLRGCETKNCGTFRGIVGVLQKKKKELSHSSKKRKERTLTFLQKRTLTFLLGCSSKNSHILILMNVPHSLVGQL